MYSLEWGQRCPEQAQRATTGPPLAADLLRYQVELHAMLRTTACPLNEQRVL